MRTIVIIALLSIALPREALSQDRAHDSIVDLAKYHIAEGTLICMTEDMPVVWQIVP